MAGSKHWPLNKWYTAEFLLFFPSQHSRIPTETKAMSAVSMSLLQLLIVFIPFYQILEENSLLIRKIKHNKPNSTTLDLLKLIVHRQTPWL